MASTFTLPPPDPSAASSYKLWRKDVLIWKKLTDLAADKKGLTLQYACRTNERMHKVVVDIPEDQVECTEGVDNVLKVLDTLFKTDQMEAELKTYQEFMNIQKNDDQTVADFINKFEACLKKIKEYGNVISDNILVEQLIRATNLTESQQQIIL